MFENLKNLKEGMKAIKDLQSKIKDVDMNDPQKMLDAFGINMEEIENAYLNYEPEKQKVIMSFSRTNQNAVTPSYAYPTDSGFDLYSTEEKYIEPFGRELIPTGLHFDIPENYEIQVRSKSGLALKQGLMVLNSPGTVDQGYTGEVQVILFNTTKEKVKIEKGQKVAQAVVCPILTSDWLEIKEVDSVENKDRGINGFGSTGI